MKKLLAFILMLCYVICAFAQTHVYVWHRNGTIDVTSFGKMDSLTFYAPVKSSISLQTGDPSEVTANSMTASFVIKGPKYRGLSTERGVCLSSVDTEPTTNNIKVVDGRFDVGSWTCTVENLDSGRTYYYRPYAKIGYDTLYGPIKSFVTTGIKREASYLPEAIDLGLSVKWASFNLGATDTHEIGGYYAWGETSTKNIYNWTTYKYGDEYKKTKYNSEDGLGILSPDDDAASVNLGRPWRMPTYDELTELQQKCSWEWTTIDGCSGCRVIGPNGNSIFLPAAGIVEDTNHRYVNLRGYYLYSRTEYFPEGYLPWQLFDQVGHTYGFQVRRCLGYSVRPVCP